MKSSSRNDIQSVSTHLHVCGNPGDVSGSAKHFGSFTAKCFILHTLLLILRNPSNIYSLLLCTVKIFCSCVTNMTLTVSLEVIQSGDKTTHVLSVSA